jgi:hypothetical protein
MIIKLKRSGIFENYGWQFFVNLRHYNSRVGKAMIHKKIAPEEQNLYRKKPLYKILPALKRANDNEKQFSSNKYKF